MKSFKQVIYFHREKEDNRNIREKAEMLGFSNTEELRYLGEEIELEIEVFEDGTRKILAIERVDVSEHNLSI